MNVRGIRPDFSGLSPSPGQITYVLLSRLPLAPGPKPHCPFDLHALGAPPAFVLSQDQTLNVCVFTSTIQLLRCRNESYNTVFDDVKAKFHALVDSIY